MFLMADLGAGYICLDSSPLSISTLFHAIHLKPNHNHIFTKTSIINCQKLVSFKKFILLHCFNVTQLYFFSNLMWFRLFTKSELPSSQLSLITEVLSVVASWSFAIFQSRNLINSSKVLFIFAVLVFLPPQDR